MSEKKMSHLNFQMMRSLSRRALLYMPGDDMHKIQKAITLGVDCICMDLEDGVAANRKQAARETITAALSTLDFARSEKLVRINAVDSGLAEQDLEAILPVKPHGIVVPKVRDAAQIQWVSQKMASLEKALRFEAGEIPLLAIVETARGIVNLKEIAQADPRLAALIFGAEDLAGDMGAIRTPQGTEVFYARSAVVLHAKAFGLDAIDMIFADFHDEEGLRNEALQAVQMGFSGKQIIHPNQVKPVQEVFTPNEEQISKALEIIRLYENHLEKGVGAFAINGKLIDAPIIKAARQILARAYAAGKL